MVVGLIGIGLSDRAAAQAGKAAAPAKGAPAAAKGDAAKGPTAGEAFKNVTTNSLKGLTVSDFLGAMGVMAAALGYDCADCHPGAGGDTVDWVFDTPKKKTARRMVDMVAGINNTYFGRGQFVTCFTCHHGRDLPSTTIALDTLYGPPSEEKRDVIAVGEGVPSADQIFDKYIQALGGAQRLNGLTSYIMSGNSVGYEGLGGGGSFQIMAQAPDRRTVFIEFKDHPERGNNIRAYNGGTGWVRSPRGLLPEYDMTGSELEGLRLEAQLAFPGQIKQVLNNWRVGNDSMGDREVYVVQGTRTGGFLASLYFEKDTGLLSRLVRYSASPIGRVPTQVDYSDYKDVGGIKFPFKITLSWLDGKDEFRVSEVRVNVPVDATKFNKQ
jgi:hypothetical protein